jgi:hypothetical protein
MKIQGQTGFDMKASDNEYHITMRVGKAVKSVTNKYSEAAVDILRAVLNDREYELVTEALAAGKNEDKKAKLIARSGANRRDAEPGGSFARMSRSGISRGNRQS